LRALAKAREAVLAGNVEEAAAEARRAASARPDHPEPQQFLAELVLAQGMNDAARRAEGERAATRALAAEPEAAILHYTRALYHRAAGENAAAYRELFAAHRLYPQKPLYQSTSIPAGEKRP